MHCGLVHRVDAGADRVIVIAILHCNESFLQRLDVAAFLARELLPGSIALFFGEHSQDRVCFAPRFNDLPLPEILFGVVERFEQHVLDLLVGEGVSGLNVDFSLLSAALLARRDAQNTIRVDQKLYFNARHAGGHRRNALQIESRQRPAIPRQFAFALQHVNRNVGLAIHLSRVILRRRSGHSRVAQDNLVSHAARYFNAQRKWGYIEQQHILRDFGAAAQNVRLHGRAQSHHFVRI